MMKVVGINGSPRKEGNTALLIQNVFNELNREGIDTELISLSGQNIRSCRLNLLEHGLWQFDW
jgi:multimeric flavodoxin WrbA